MTMEHQLEITEAAVIRCKVCEHTWSYKPSSDCPGVRWYEWQTAPEMLKTKAQLRALELRLERGAKPVGCLRTRKHGWIWLYEVGQAGPRPEPTEKQLAAIAKAQAAKLAKRTCRRCGFVADSRRDLPDGLCYWCDLDDAKAEARQESAAWAAKLLQEGDWVILDTETTGLVTWLSDVVQIAVIDANGVELMNTLVKPSKPIPSDATAIHGITNEMVAEAQPFAAHYAQLCQILNGKKVLIYNVDFDRSFLHKACQDAYLEMFKAVWVDVMEPYAAYYGEWSDYHQSYKWQPLPGGDHSALGDCRATLALIRQMAGSANELYRKSESEQGTAS